jgi:hypothetical protein
VQRIIIKSDEEVANVAPTREKIREEAQFLAVASQIDPLR